MGIAAEGSLHSISDLKTQVSTPLYLEGHKFSSRGVSRHKQYAQYTVCVLGQFESNAV